MFKFRFWAPDPDEVDEEDEEDEEEEREERYNLTNLDQALSSISTTLVEVEIGAEPVDECWLEEGVVLEEIRRMEKLKRLKIDLRLLMGWGTLTELQDALPQGLEVLEVGDWETAWFERNWVVVMLQLKAVVELVRRDGQEEGGMMLREIRAFPHGMVAELRLAKSPVFVQLMDACRTAGVMFTAVWEYRSTLREERLGKEFDLRSWYSHKGAVREPPAMPDAWSSTDSVVTDSEDEAGDEDYVEDAYSDSSSG